MDFAKGDVVKVGLMHWLRGGHVGRIIEIDGTRQTHPYLIQFEVCKPWLGIDGDKLYLSVGQLSRVEKKLGRSRRVQAHAPLSINGAD